MDDRVVRDLGEYDTVTFKTVSAAGSGLFLGSMTGAVVATWTDVPAVESNKAWPALRKTGGVMGRYGVLFATIGGAFGLADALAQEFRGKKDMWNGVIGGVAAGALLGLSVGSIASGVGAAAAFAAGAAAMDVSGQVTKTPTGRVFLPWETSSADK